MLNNAVHIDLFRVEMPGDAPGFTLPRLQLRDRRAAGQPMLHWVFQRHLESTLYGRGADGGTSGAIWKILNSTGLGSTALQVNGAAIQMGQVTQQEYNEPHLHRIRASLSPPPLVQPRARVGRLGHRPSQQAAAPRTMSTGSHKGIGGFTRR